MKYFQSLLLALIAAGLFTETQAATVGLGDQAPPLHIKNWIKGSYVDLAAGKGKKIYVIEFWATWCPTCLESIPHLTDLQAEHKGDGVVFVGITDEATPVVKAFVKKMGDKMDYKVATDPDNITADAYMNAFGVNTIPHAFVVDKSGAIIWHGNPLDGLHETLDQIVDGKYDLEAAKRYEKYGQLVQQYFTMAINEPKAPLLSGLGKRILDESTQPEHLNTLAWHILTDKEFKTRDLPLALESAKKAHELTKGKFPAISDTYAHALFDNGKVAEAIELEKRAIEACKDDELRPDLEASLKTFTAGASK